MTILGSGFCSDFQINFQDSSKSWFNATFEASIGGVQLLDVTYVDANSLTGTVPDTLDMGTHVLVVVNPKGIEARLVDAFEVRAETPCNRDEDCADPCVSTWACVEGYCELGLVDKDSDGDGFVDINCPGGDDCDDDPLRCGASCNPGVTQDATCDRRDDDCSGEQDDDYVPDDSCGTGWCRTHNNPSACVDGIESPCTPGQPLSMDDANCDGVDDNCNGEVDEDAGGSRAYYHDADGDGFTNNDDTVIACTDPDGMAATWRDAPTTQDCDDDPDLCGAACSPGIADDATCDDQDDDCSGEADEDYEPSDVCCIGYCTSTCVLSSCDEGIETVCEPGIPLSSNDATCDGVDDDCSGGDDEEYVSDATCGTGYCQTSNIPSSCDSGVETPCQPGPPLSTDDATCDGTDDDCDGATDEDYWISPTTCGQGGCESTGAIACVMGTPQDSCVAGDPISETVVSNTCADAIDNDCDGIQDDEDLDCWVEAECAKRMRIGIDNRGQPEALLEFPLLVTLPSTWPGHPVARANGLGIRFVDRDNPTQLAHEIESWSPAGTSYLWVRVRQIDADTDADRIWIYFECSADVPQNPTGVWSGDFAGVWHLHQGFDDATAHGTNGVNSGSTDTGGVIARARGFSGGEAIDMPSAAALNVQGDVTISAWARYSNLSAGFFSNSLFGNAGFADTEAVNYHYYLGISGDRALTSFWEYGAGNNVEPSSTEVASVTNGEYHFYALTRDSTNKIARFFVDGILLGNDVPYSDNPTGGQDSTLGIGHDPCCAQGYFNGRIDEVRVESVERSMHWIRAQYSSMTGQMITLGSVEP